MKIKILLVVVLSIFLAAYFNLYAQEDEPNFQNGLVRIILPANGADFYPGEMIKVRLDAKSVVKSALVVFGSNRGQAVRASGNELHSPKGLIIPDNCAAGRYTIGVLAMDEGDKPVSMDSVIINVHTPSSVNSRSLEETEE